MPSENKQGAPLQKGRREVGKEDIAKITFVPAAKTGTSRLFSVCTCIQPHQDRLWVWRESRFQADHSMGCSPWDWHS